MTPEEFDATVWLMLDAYDEIVTANRCPEWDTYIAVLADTCDEVCYEIADVAAAIGIPLPADEDLRWDVFNTVRMAYRSVLRERLIAPHRLTAGSV